MPPHTHRSTSHAHRAFQRGECLPASFATVRNARGRTRRGSKSHSRPTPAAARAILARPRFRNLRIFTGIGSLGVTAFALHDPLVNHVADIVLPALEGFTARITGACVEHAGPFLGTFTGLCLLVDGWRRGKAALVRRIADPLIRKRFDRLVPQLGMLIMYGALGMAILEMRDAPHTMAPAFVNAYGDAIVSGACIATIKGAEHAAEKEDRPWLRILKALTMYSCLIDDALHPMFAFLRWGWF